MKTVSDVYLNSDDYPREGCRIVVDVNKCGYTISMFRPNGGLLEVYGARSPERLAEIIQDWSGGRAPRRRYEPLGSRVTSKSSLNSI